MEGTSIDHRAQELVDPVMSLSDTTIFERTIFGMSIKYKRLRTKFARQKKIILYRRS